MSIETFLSDRALPNVTVSERVLIFAPTEVTISFYFENAIVSK